MSTKSVPAILSLTLLMLQIYCISTLNNDKTSKILNNFRLQILIAFNN